MFIRSNLPNRIEVAIGRRVGNTLQIHTWKSLSNKKIKHNSTRGGKEGEYILDGSLSDISVKRSAFMNPVMIFDEDSATQCIGLKGKMIIKDDNLQTVKFIKDKETGKYKPDTNSGLTSEQINTIQEQLDKGQIKVVNGKLPIRYDINPIWKVSAQKMKRYFKDQMIDSTWKAIIMQTFTDNKTLVGIVIGSALGASLVIGIYPFFAPVHYIPVTQVTTTTVTSIKSVSG